MTPALLRSLSAIVLLVVCWQAPILAQQAARATLTGIVTDPNGAVVAGVKVTATLASAGIKRETVTNDEGLYVLTDLVPGEYEVRVEATGFVTKVSKVPISLNVGQSVTLNVPLEIGLSETTVVDLYDDRRSIYLTDSLVQGVVERREVESLPLNGRNFLELALLIPGNAPAPNFDPTKTNTFVISSAGQLGRGGNVTIDGADNNDDVVGGPVQNISQEAIAEFQIVTNRFSAQMGRSASSVVNVITKAGTNALHGSGSVYFRNSELQALPATFDRSLGQDPPFDRQQYAFTLGGPIKKDRAWFFGSFEYRNQDGVVLVGERNLATRTITRGFADAPLDDFLTTERVDLAPTDRDNLSLRYSFQREKGTNASTLVRSIGSASQRQSGLNRTHSFISNYTHVFSPRDLNSFRFSYSTFINDT
jgi:hypothetical protein